MPSRPYTTLFSANAGTAAGFVYLFSPAAGYLTVVRDILIGNIGSNPARYVVYWLYQGQAFDLWRLEVTGDSTAHQDMRQVVPIQSTVQLYTDSTNWTVAITGYRLIDQPGAGFLPVLPGWADAKVASRNT